MFYFKVSMSLSSLGQTATHFDKVAGLSHLKFNSLAASIAEMMSGKKVLAALIMKTSAQDEGTVVSLGTGGLLRRIAVYSSYCLCLLY